jgi:hypothetical protein
MVAHALPAVIAAAQREPHPADVGLAYVRAASGNPCSAWGHQTSHGWY